MMDKIAGYLELLLSSFNVIALIALAGLIAAAHSAHKAKKWAFFSVVAAAYFGGFLAGAFGFSWTGALLSAAFVPLLLACLLHFDEKTMAKLPKSLRGRSGFAMVAVGAFAIPCAVLFVDLPRRTHNAEMYGAQVANPNWRASATWIGEDNLPIKRVSGFENAPEFAGIWDAGMNDPILAAAEAVAKSIGGKYAADFQNAYRSHDAFRLARYTVSIFADGDAMNVPDSWPNGPAGHPALPASSLVQCFIGADMEVIDITLPLDQTGIDAMQDPDMQPLRDLCNAQRDVDMKSLAEQKASHEELMDEIENRKVES